MRLPFTFEEAKEYVRQAAIARGADPEIALQVARSEGLQPGTWQGKSMLKYGLEQSYGPFQLHRAPEGYQSGMGNDFQKATGLDPADPANWRQTVDYGLNQAIGGKGGWGPWYGAKVHGITGKMGLENAHTMPLYSGVQNTQLAQASNHTGPPDQYAGIQDTSTDPAVADTGSGIFSKVKDYYNNTVVPAGEQLGSKMPMLMQMAQNQTNYKQGIMNKMDDANKGYINKDYVPPRNPLFGGQQPTPNGAPTITPAGSGAPQGGGLLGQIKSMFGGGAAPAARSPTNLVPAMARYGVQPHSGNIAPHGGGMLGGIASLLGSLGGGGGAEPPPPAPLPQIQTKSYQGSGPAPFDYGPPESEEDKRRRMLGM
jgi:hypothetical protein